MSITLSSFTSTVSNVWNMVGYPKYNVSALDKLTHNQLIHITDYIRDIFKDSMIMDPPALCVVGSQSSGKSITLNGLIGIDILPNGKSIVTRTPIHLRLIHVNDSKNIVIDFLDKDDNQKLISTHTIDASTYTTDQLIPIRDEIVKLTELYAGGSKNVVDIPINIRIKSPSVPNLSIIDLPGLTNIALMDQGQPENIKGDIENMIIKYIRNPKTIILSIIPAIIDVESDMGLGLIKIHDPGFVRTIGVLTKIDMLKDSNVENYLSGKISRNLQLGYGYYAVRNRSSDEAKTMNQRDGYALEAKLFAETEPYKSSENKQRMGSINLGIRLSEILLAHLRACLPGVMDEIKNKAKYIEDQLSEIGHDYPETESAKKTTLVTLLYGFQREYTGAILDRGAHYNTGSWIAESFRQLSLDIDQIDPCNALMFNDEMINALIRDYNGIHMPDLMISTGIIEKYFQGGVNVSYMIPSNDTENRGVANENGLNCDGMKSMGMGTKKIEPIKSLKGPYVRCIMKVQSILINLIDTILSQDNFSRFPQLCTKIKENIVSIIISERYVDTNNKIDDLLTEETECIWTDDQKFRCNVLPGMISKSKDGSVEPLVIRGIFTEYFNIVRTHFNHSVHKKIHTFFVNRIVDDINMRLVDLIITKGDFNHLLEEHKEKALKRERLNKLKEKIDMTKSMINSIC